MKTKNQLFLLCIFTITAHFYLNANIHIQFKHTIKYSAWLWQEVKISYTIDAQEIGFIYYIQLPFYCYILYDFYIFPNYRKKGYGTALLAYICNFLQQRGSHSIFVQPGPFELGEKLPKNNHYYAKLGQLVSLYAQFGFERISHFSAQVASLFYWLLNIDENPHYLMVLRIQNFTKTVETRHILG